MQIAPIGPRKYLLFSIVAGGIDVSMASRWKVNHHLDYHLLLYFHGLLGWAGLRSIGWNR